MMSPDRPSATVITVCLNNLDGLIPTSRSILAQRDVDLEWIVVDGGSRDGSVEFLTRLERVRWTSGPDRGIFDAMNKGVAMATGEWILFMNSGDTFVEELSLGKLLHASENLDVAYGDAFFSYGDSLRLKLARSPGWIPWMPPCVHQSLAARADLLRRFPFDSNLDLAADYAFLLQAWDAKARIARKRLTVSVYDRRGTSDHNWLKALRQWQDIGARRREPVSHRAFKRWLRLYFGALWRLRSLLPPDLLRQIRRLRGTTSSAPGTN